MPMLFDIFTELKGTQQRAYPDNDTAASVMGSQEYGGGGRVDPM